MTRIDVDPGDDGPRLHAFVVGVGHYPYCGERPGEPSPSRRLLADLGSLTAPPYSARRVVDWLLDNPVDGAGLRLGTVEVLISDHRRAAKNEPVRIETPEGSFVDVDPAVFANFRASFRAWRRRCHSRLDNVALFFFCGHGWGRRGAQLLLLEDVGQDPDALLENAASFAAAYAVMEGCRARTQVYFVDSCRETPRELLELNEECGALMGASHVIELSSKPLNAPVIFSTPPGLPAFGPTVEEETPFTTALLQTLDGLGATRRDGRWPILVESLGTHLRDVIEWNTPPRATMQHPSAEGRTTHRGILRTLAAPPLVPLQVTCEPADALGSASTVCLRSLDSREVEPPTADVGPIGADGRGEVRAGMYELELAYKNGRYQKARGVRDVIPPNQTWHLPVRPA